MQPCQVCGVEKADGEFYAHDRTCKPCRRVRVRSNRLANLERYRVYDRKRASQPHRRANTKRVSVRWIATHRERRRAQVLLGNALRDRRIVRPDACMACLRKMRVEAHHHDYSKPLDVLWLCKPCHVLADKTRREMERAA